MSPKDNCSCDRCRKNVTTLMGKWEILEKLGKGGCGEVFKLVRLNDPDRKAAGKVEDIRPNKPMLLDNEYRFYENVSRGIIGFPRCYGYGDGPGREQKTLIMSLLGPSVDNLFSTYHRQFSEKTVLMISLQAVKRIEEMHDMGFLHRDIKTQNLMIGRKDRDTIYIIDFGLTKKYKDSNNNHMSDDGKVHGFVGTKRYASINVHKGRRGTSLPWGGINDEKEVGQLKMNLSLGALCEHSPGAVKDFMRYVRGLGFKERPNYGYIRDLFRNSLRKRGVRNDKKFDWISSSHQRIRSRRH